MCWQYLDFFPVRCFTTAWIQTHYGCVICIFDKDTLGYASVGDGGGRGEVVHTDMLKLKNGNESANIILIQVFGLSRWVWAMCSTIEKPTSVDLLGSSVLASKWTG